MVQQKQEALAKTARRDIATLVEKGKLETARVRVEHTVRPSIHISRLPTLLYLCFNIIQLFMNGLRLTDMIEQINEDIRVELLELLELYCELLIARFGLLDMKYVPQLPLSLSSPRSIPTLALRAI